MRDMIKEEIQCSLQSQSDLPSTSSANIRGSSSDEDTGPQMVGKDNPDPDYEFSSSDESSSHNFHPNEVEHLLKAVKATMALEERKKEKSVEDRMFEG